MTETFGDEDVAAIRAATPGCRHGLAHLNHAGSSLPPQVVLDTEIAHLRREAKIGGCEAADEAREREAAVYESIGRLLGAPSRDIARFEHATAAWNAVFWSLPFRPGQRISTTTGSSLAAAARPPSPPTAPPLGPLHDDERRGRPSGRRAPARLIRSPTCPIPSRTPIRR